MAGKTSGICVQDTKVLIGLFGRYKSVKFDIITIQGTIRIRIKWNGCYSEHFTVSNGVRPRCNFSPSIWCVPGCTYMQAER